MVLRTEAPAPGEIESRFENITTKVLNLVSDKDCYDVSDPGRLPAQAVRE